MDVSWTALEPSESASQISHDPERSDAKATRRPSGESWGVESIFVEEIAITGDAEAVAPGAENSTRQMFASWKLRTYAKRGVRPGGDRETTGMMASSPPKGNRAGVFLPNTTKRQRLRLAQKRISLLPGTQVVVIACYWRSQITAAG